MKIKQIIIGGILTVVIATCASVGFVYANPSYFIASTSTSSATTSPAWMAPTVSTNNGTSTLAFDSYAAAPGGVISNLTKVSQASLLVQFAASSTVGVLNIAFEYSNGVSGVDCVATPLSCDWYKDSLLDNNSRSTTTAPASITQSNTLSWQFASSSTGGAAVGAGLGTSTRAILVATPTRYVRAIFWMSPLAANSPNGNVWAQFTPVKERAE